MSWHILLHFRKTYLSNVVIFIFAMMIISTNKCRFCLECLKLTLFDKYVLSLLQYQTNELHFTLDDHCQINLRFYVLYLLFSFVCNFIDHQVPLCNIIQTESQMIHSQMASQQNSKNENKRYSFTRSTTSRVARLYIIAYCVNNSKIIQTSCFS